MAFDSPDHAAPPSPPAEAQAVAQRYGRRDAAADAARYSLLNPAALALHLERLGALSALLRRRVGPDLSGWQLVEVGCGSGGNLLDLIRLGAEPERLCGLELLPERAAAARRLLPAAVRVVEGDALRADLPAASQDAVAQFTVFSSLLDDAFQQRLADAMWHWLKPGGGVLWYDFAIDNPRNPDVRGVPLHRVRQLFPAGTLTSVQRVTLAPPLARAVCRLHPALYGVFNCLPLLRTHRLVWIEKPHS